MLFVSILVYFKHQKVYNNNCVTIIIAAICKSQQNVENTNVAIGKILSNINNNFLYTSYIV